MCMSTDWHTGGHRLMVYRVLSNACFAFVIKYFVVEVICNTQLMSLLNSTLCYHTTREYTLYTYYIIYYTFVSYINIYSYICHIYSSKYHTYYYASNRSNLNNLQYIHVLKYSVYTT